MGGTVVDQGLTVAACVARATLADVAAACLAEAKCTIIAGEAAAGGGHILAQVTGITRRAGAKSSIGEVEAGSLVVAGAGGAVVDGCKQTTKKLNFQRELMSRGWNLPN